MKRGKLNSKNLYLIRLYLFTQLWHIYVPLFIDLASCEIVFALFGSCSLYLFILRLVSDTIDNYVQKGLYRSCIILINVNICFIVLFSSVLSFYNYNYYYQYRCFICLYDIEYFILISKSHQSILCTHTTFLSFMYVLQLSICFSSTS